MKHSIAFILNFVWISIIIFVRHIHTPTENRDSNIFTAVAFEYFHRQFCQRIFSILFEDMETLSKVSARLKMSSQKRKNPVSWR